MIKAVIIDDEARSRSVLREMLHQFCPEVSIVADAGDLQQAVKLISEHQPNLAFLDVNMPNGSGFEVLQAFPQADFEVIFITAHDEHALRAIKVSALDFLLKPINIRELQEAVQKAKIKLAQKGEQNHLKVLIENLSQNFKGQSKIAVPVAKGLRFIPLEHIVRLEADGNYTRLYLLHEKGLLSTRHLKEYEELLSVSVFFRAHHSHLINLHHIVEYHRGEGGSVSMVDQSHVPIAKRRKKAFLELFNA